MHHASALMPLMGLIDVKSLMLSSLRGRWGDR